MTELAVVRLKKKTIIIIIIIERIATLGGSNTVVKLAYVGIHAGPSWLFCELSC